MTTDVMAVPRGRRRVPPAIRSAIGEGEHSPDPAEERTLAFLGEILTGDAPWRLSEVQKLLELHTLISVERWHADGLDCLASEPRKGRRRA